ncbi:MAG TPA: DNA gyrase inhibitor YacG [Thiolapillus brandeum]|uniref:DNA gyrase inhibitor YacG n=1 Tax=Thiolapillus brandeum TaxID=1076588 RepID=A0A831RX73_9GAMM|nr:DNA gyrase inhibitor YacG [Thiolapillus brandeum]
MQSDDQSTNRPATLVACPTCGRPVKWEEASIWRPFCSRRCQLIDLNEWLSDDEEQDQQPSG